MRTANQLSVSTQSNKHIDIINTFTQDVISNSAQAIRLLEAVKKHPDNFLIHCYAASLQLFSQTKEGAKQAKSYLNQARALRKQANTREQLIFQALDAWANHDFMLAIKIFTNITRDYPQDLLCAKYAEWLFYLTGQKYNAAAMLAMCEKMAPHYHNNPYFDSTYSFALELDGQRLKAIDIAQRAIDVEASTAWAHHTLAHAYLLLGKLDICAKTLTALSHHWQSVAAPLKSHNYWHLGLLYIANRDQTAAAKLFHETLWGDAPEQVYQQVDSISYLWRMEMAGLAHQQSWQEIFTHLQAHAQQAYIPFSSLHFIYACMRAQEHNYAQLIIDNAQQHAQTCHGFEAFSWQFAGLPALKATMAFTQQDYKKTLTLLEPVLADIPACGGSDAQIEILQEMYCLALIKSKQQPKAIAYFNQELSFYQGSALEEFWFS